MIQVEIIKIEFPEIYRDIPAIYINGVYYVNTKFTGSLSEIVRLK